MQGILLAAGFGRRFNANAEPPQDKLLTQLSNHKTIKNKSILWHSATALINALPNSIAVIQPDQIERKALLQDLGFVVLESERAETGMGYAIADAVLASQQANGWLIALADMPWVTTELIQQVSQQVSAQASIAAPRFNGQRGQPVAFGTAWGKQLAALEGDVGARALLQRNDINWLDWHDDSIHRDVDTQKDLIAY